MDGWQVTLNRIPKTMSFLCFVRPKVRPKPSFANPAAHKMQQTKDQGSEVVNQMGRKVRKQFELKNEELARNTNPGGGAKHFKPCLASIDDQKKLSRANVPPPSTNVKNNFCWRCSVWMGFDVETHDMAPPSERDWEDGEFGHLRRVVGVDLVRALYIVQLGWTIGCFDQAEEPITKTYTVRPRGFTISAAAIRCHKITQEIAMEQGVGITEALNEFMQDFKRIRAARGRVCAHNIEFDATIITCEMSRAGLNVDDIAEFRCALHCGFCTFDPTLTKWCCEEFLRSISQYGIVEAKTEVPVRLSEVLRVLDEEAQASCVPAHNAGRDARAVWLIVRELRRLVRNSMA
jgi:hypothetical protein